MRILFLEWKSFGNDFILDTFKQLGHEVVCFPFPREKEDTRNSEMLATGIAERMLKEKFDAVFSFNFFPVAAIACKACKVKYISWVYDSPFIQLYSETVKYDTNRVYVFDSAECMKLRGMGIDTVYYLPMAAAVEYYDKMLPTPSQEMKYQCDIAFIGSTYAEERQHMFRHLKDLDEYTRGYLDAAMTAQKHVYGYNFMENILTPDIVKKMQKVCPVTKHGDGFETIEWVFATYFLDRKITSMERTEILELLSEKWKVNLYTPEATPNLKKINNQGKLDYYTEAPLAMKCAKINLNITLKSIVNGIPLRAMDVMACGGFLMTNFQSDFMEYFVPGEDFVFYEDYDDLMKKADYYLSHEDERKQIAHNGYEKVKALHTYKDRVQTMLQI